MEATMIFPYIRHVCAALAIIIQTPIALAEHATVAFELDSDSSHILRNYITSNLLNTGRGKDQLNEGLATLSSNFESDLEVFLSDLGQGWVIPRHFFDESNPVPVVISIEGDGNMDSLTLSAKVLSDGILGDRNEYVLLRESESVNCPLSGVFPANYHLAVEYLTGCVWKHLSREFDSLYVEIGQRKEHFQDGRRDFEPLEEGVVVDIIRGLTTETKSVEISRAEIPIGKNDSVQAWFACHNAVGIGTAHQSMSLSKGVLVEIIGLPEIDTENGILLADTQRIAHCLDGRIQVELIVTKFISTNFVGPYHSRPPHCDRNGMQSTDEGSIRPIHARISRCSHEYYLWPPKKNSKWSRGQ